MPQDSIPEKRTAGLSAPSASAAGYLSGFGNTFETEALPGALPVGRNSPQRCSYGLYAEQISGSPFTAPRASNERSWLYRIRPSVRIPASSPRPTAGSGAPRPAIEDEMPIGQLRWSPTPIPSQPLSFIEGMRTMTTAGDAGTQTGMARPRLSGHPLDDRRGVLERRRRVADRAAGRAAALRHRVRRHRCRARRNRGDPARRQVPGGVARWPRAGLRLRELRRRIHLARARPHRRQLPGQCPRFPVAGCRLRGPRHAHAACSSSGAARSGKRNLVIRRSMSSPGTATTRPSNTICAASTRSARSRSTTPTPRSSPCSPRHRKHLAPRMSISSSSPSAGWWPRTPSARPGTTATSCRSSWGSFTASMTPSPQDLRRAP